MQVHLKNYAAFLRTVRNNEALAQRVEAAALAQQTDGSVGRLTAHSLTLMLFAQSCCVGRNWITATTAETQYVIADDAARHFATQRQRCCCWHCRRRCCCCCDCSCVTDDTCNTADGFVDVGPNRSCDCRRSRNARVDASVDVGQGDGIGADTASVA
jgi:hypothetical protein